MGFNTSEAPEQAVTVLEGMSFEVRCNKDGQPSLWAPSSRQILPQKLTQTANSGSSILLASHLHNSSTKTTSIWPWAISWPQTLWMIFTLTMFKFRAQKLEIQCNYFTRCKAQQYVQYIQIPLATSPLLKSLAGSRSQRRKLKCCPRHTYLIIH